MKKLFQLHKFDSLACVKQRRLFDAPLFLYGKKFSTWLCIIGRNRQTIFLELNYYVTGF